MCTVTYIPQLDQQFILTSNRDENAARSPQNISSITQDGIQLIFPRDKGAGGSWIGISDTNKVVCLLNGAFEQHQRTPPYRKSRGIMVLEFFSFSSADEFFQNYVFQGMEPFTMVIFDDGQLFEFRWDGEHKHVQVLHPRGYYIWSSATLYDKTTIQKREQWFADWLAQQQFDLDSIMDFHQNAGEGDPFNDVVMNRNGLVQTVSITNIIKSDDQIQLKYLDLLRKQQKEAELDLNPSTKEEGMTKANR
jgi:uncharacterized protein with NRDE domain